MHDRARRLGLGLAVALMGGFLGFGQTSQANELPGDYQPRAAINHPANERIVTDWSVTRTIEGTDIDGTTVYLRPGATYSITAAGHIDYGTGQAQPWLADAECSVEATGQHSAQPHRWRTDRWNDKYERDYLDLVMIDAVGDVRQAREIDWVPVKPFRDVSRGDSRCSTIHTYKADFVAPSANVQLFFDDQYGFDDNAGHLTVTLSGPAPTFDQQYPCPKWTEEKGQVQPGRTLGEIDLALMYLDARRDAGEHPDPSELQADGSRRVDYWDETGHFGMYTCNWVVPDGTYLLEVQGTYGYGGEGNIADAECSRTGDDPRFIADRFVEQDNIEERDWLDLYPAYTQMDWVPMGRIDPNDDRCSLDHLYCVLFTPSFAGPLNMKIYDIFYAEADNTGGLSVSIQKIS